MNVHVVCMVCVSLCVTVWYESMTVCLTYVSMALSCKNVALCGMST
jgi:hypothetical protein